MRCAQKHPMHYAEASGQWLAGNALTLIHICCRVKPGQGNYLWIHWAQSMASRHKALPPLTFGEYMALALCCLPVWKASAGPPGTHSSQCQSAWKSRQYCLLTGRHNNAICMRLSRTVTVLLLGICMSSGTSVQVCRGISTSQWPCLRVAYHSLCKGA